jgi:Ran-binding protein 3
LDAESTHKNSQQSSTAGTTTLLPSSLSTGVSIQPFDTSKASAVTPPSSTFDTAATKSETSDKKAETTPKPAFSVGTASTNNTTTTESSKESAEKPAFSFGTFNKTGFSFAAQPSSIGSPSLGFTTKKEADTSQKNNQETEDADGTDTDEDISKEESTPLEARVGEENEDTVYTTRSKIYHDTTDGYKNQGVGVLRLNREKDNPNMSRIICRIDGTGGILLNARIYKGMPVDVIGKAKKDVQMLVHIDGKMTKILLRVKDAATAAELEEKLKELISNCS